MYGFCILYTHTSLHVYYGFCIWYTQTSLHVHVHSASQSIVWLYSYNCTIALCKSSNPTIALRPTLSFFVALLSVWQQVILSLSCVVCLVERLEREYDMDLIVTAPSVVYKVIMNGPNNEEKFIDTPSKLPDPSTFRCIMEPYVRLEMITPTEYTGENFSWSRILCVYYYYLQLMYSCLLLLPLLFFFSVYWLSMSDPHLPHCIICTLSTIQHIVSKWLNHDYFCSRGSNGTRSVTARNLYRT